MGLKSKYVATLRAIGRAGVNCSQINEIAKSNAEKKHVEHLLEEGFLNVGQCDSSIMQMASEAVCASIAQTELAPTDIDALLVCTESFWDSETSSDGANTHENSLGTALLDALIVKSGISNAQPYGNWLSACGNLASTLSVAKALVCSGQHDRVMLVMSDRLRPTYRRINTSDSNLFGDMAVSAIVERFESGFIIRNVVTHTAPLLYELQRRRDTVGQAREMKKAIEILSSKFQIISGHQVSDFQHIICDNHNSMVLGLVASGLGVRASQLLTPTRSSFAHTFSTDGLLSLAALSQNSFRNKDRILLVNIGLLTVG